MPRPQQLPGLVPALLTPLSLLSPQGVMQGTIPYLGTFLTDLVMLDTAMKDFLDVCTSSLCSPSSLSLG